jgi:hypothetical protein
MIENLFKLQTTNAFMKQVSQICTSALALTLSGCAATYIAPPTETAARLRVTVPNSGFFSSVTVNAYPSGQCEAPMSLGMIGGMAKHNPDKGVGMPDSKKFPPGTSIEKLIPSGTPYIVTLRGLYSLGKECYISMKIKPVKGEDYEMNYTWDGAKCYLTLDKLNTTTTGEVSRSKATNVEQTEVCNKGFN